MALLEAKDILKILPHKYPMLLIDRVIECNDKDHIIAIKNLTFNEPFFQGHFPGDPIMPGVLQLEAMAQAAGVLVNRHFGKTNAIAYFLAIDNARFRRPCVPGDQLRIEVNFVKARLKMIRLRGTVTVEGDLASEAELMFAYKED